MRIGCFTAGEIGVAAGATALLYIPVTFLGMAAVGRCRFEESALKNFDKARGTTFSQVDSDENGYLTVPEAREWVSKNQNTDPTQFYRTMLELRNLQSNPYECPYVFASRNLTFAYEEAQNTAKSSKAKSK